MTALDGLSLTAADPTIEELDFDVPCDNDIHQEAPPPADWIMWRVKCCRKVPIIYLSCDPCRQRIWSMAIGWCSHCQWRFVPPSGAFYRVEAIKPVAP